MKQKICLVGLVFFLFQSCKSQKNNQVIEKQVTIKTLLGDTVLSFIDQKKDTLKIFRKIEIIENLNNDTLLLGYSIIPPKFKGEIIFIQNGLDTDKAIYIDKNAIIEPDNEEYYTNLFSISVWGNTKKSINNLKLKIIIK